MSDLTIIIMLAWALSACLALGWMTQRMGLSPLVGYLLAGVVVGPYTPGFVADSQLAAQFAEIGVIMLLFSVGLHFHYRDLLRVWRIAVPGAIGQSVVAAILGWLVARAFGWSDVAGLTLGFALAVASTVVLMRMLIEQQRLDTDDGHAAVGWLIVEDLLTVVALVILPTVVTGPANEFNLGWSLVIALGKVVIFAALVLVIGSRIISPILEQMSRASSAELFTLGVFVFALGIAAIAAELFHVSVALGAFFGGLVVAQSSVGQHAAENVKSFRDVFSALFFVSVGMLFNPAFIWENVGITLAVLAIILLAKPAIALAIVLMLRHPFRTGLTVGVGLAQIGEFSFILAGLGKSLGLLPQAGFDVLVAVALISIAVNPLLFKATGYIERRWS